MIGNRGRDDNRASPGDAFGPRVTEVLWDTPAASAVVRSNETFSSGRRTKPWRRLHRGVVGATFGNVDV